MEEKCKHPAIYFVIPTLRDAFGEGQCILCGQSFDVVHRDFDYETDELQGFECIISR